MADAFSVSPVGLEATPSLAVRRLSSGAASVTSLSSAGSSPSSIVELSGLGLLLSALAEGRGDLENLPLAAIATDLLQFLSADTVLNDVALSDLDLAALGLDAATLENNPDVRAGSLRAYLLALPSEAAMLVTPEEAVNLPAPTAPAAKAEALRTSVEAVPAEPATAAVTSRAALPENLISAATGGIVNDALAAEREASAATLALQALLSNPASGVMRKHFDPAYSALIAAAHLRDFIVPAPAGDAKRVARLETPAAVNAAERLRALAEDGASAAERH